eukprot:TRINITY_DN82735_c0_g1_i1.p1 TRINITY_DN82735_c0_g1~~TRINITY_DN82735_c0_g1_i1.p1  ORF type:complete len:965 (-),score=195.90 TRINITY_DN82735_c0_g1_i1:219-3113(-)
MSSRIIAVHFSVRHPDETFGKTVHICGSLPEMGGWKHEASIPLSYSQRIGVWEGTITATLAADVTVISYKYFVQEADGSVLWEEGVNRTLQADTLKDKAFICDTFHTRHTADERIHCSSAFSDVLFRRDHRRALHYGPLREIAQRNAVEPLMDVHVHVFCGEISPNHELCICGDSAFLGDWVPSEGVPLDVDPIRGFPWFVGTLRLPKSSKALEYKFLINTGDISNPVWESRDWNRKLDLWPIEASEVHLEVEAVAIPLPLRTAGIVIPVFAIRTKEDIGCGEFLDIKKLVDWCVTCGLHVLMTLPVNDTSKTLTWKDSYPYSPITSFGLHPMYVNIAAALESAGIKMDETWKQRMEDARIELDQTVPEDHDKRLDDVMKRVRYDSTLRFKLDCFKDIFDAIFPFEKELEKKIFAFVKESEFWLPAYAVYCTLREEYKSADFLSWKESDPTPEFIAEQTSKTSPRYKKIMFWYFVQYILDIQLREASEYAAKNRVILKGDLPIGVDGNSADAWVRRGHFCLDTDTGAPPDSYSAIGQNWHFPNYNWEDMVSDGYEWWKQRFATLGRYFHAIRVDHILGFFRIWRIPKGDAALRGYLFPSHGVHEDELRRNGIWDHDRLCRCQFKRSDFIAVFDKLEMNGSIFIDFFTQYLPDEHHNKITFKSEFKLFSDVEKKVEEEVMKWDEFKNHDERAAREVRKKIIEGLQILWGSVVFVRDIHNPSILYPRFECWKCPSFEDLDDKGWRKWIRDFAEDYFYNDRNTSLWTETANHRLGVIQSASRMFICGEDLGFVPPCVHPVMKAFGIPGQRVQTMPVSSKDRYMRTETFPYDSVAVRAVHDTCTLRKEWITTEIGKMHHFYFDILGMPFPFKKEATPAIVERVIWQHLDCPSMIVAFQWQEWIAMSESLKKESPHHERVNIPDRFPHYWRYRMHMYVEEMLDEGGNRKVMEWNSAIRKMIIKSRRWLM